MVGNQPTLLISCAGAANDGSRCHCDDGPGSKFHCGDGPDPEPEPLLARGPAVAAPGGGEIKHSGLPH